MIDTPAARHNRPEGSGLTWADISAEGQADLWFACLFELGPAPTVASVREWYAKRRPVFRFATLPPEEVEARGKGLAACLMCMCVFGAIGILAVYALVGVLTGK